MLVDRRPGFRLGGRNDGLEVLGAERWVTAAGPAGCPCALRFPSGRTDSLSLGKDSLVVGLGLASVFAPSGASG